MLWCARGACGFADRHGPPPGTGTPSPQVLHNQIVGMMHGTMAIIQVLVRPPPVIVMRTGCRVTQRAVGRGFDWIHTREDQGALVRPYTSGTTQRRRRGGPEATECEL